MSIERIELNFKATPIYYKTIDAKTRLVINRGGAGSSKSYSVLQVLITKFLTERGKKILILRKTLPSLRASTWEDFKKIIAQMNLGGYVREEKQFLNYYYKDNHVRFSSIDNPEKVKSTNYSYIFMEEATEFDYQDYQQLKLMLREPSIDGNRNQIFMAFNPVDEFHWIKEKVLDIEGNITEIISNYKDNPFLDKEYIHELENLIDQDINYHRVYALGEWGKLENLIYRNWQKVSSSPPADGIPFYGLDFGFNAPSAMVKVSPFLDNNKKNVLLVQELIYKPKLTNADLIAHVGSIIPKSDRHHPIYCDSAEPDRILEFRKAGYNAKPAEKRVHDGIDFVKRFKLLYPSGSINLIKESQAYSWKTDKDGNILDEPIDFMDHLKDAERYAIYTHLGKKKKYRIRWLGKRRGR